MAGFWSGTAGGDKEGEELLRVDNAISPALRTIMPSVHVRDQALPRIPGVNRKEFNNASVTEAEYNSNTPIKDAAAAASLHNTAELVGTTSLHPLLTITNNLPLLPTTWLPSREEMMAAKLSVREQAQKDLEDEVPRFAFTKWIYNGKKLPKMDDKKESPNAVPIIYAPNTLDAHIRSLQSQIKHLEEELAEARRGEAESCLKLSELQAKTHAEALARSLNRRAINYKEFIRPNAGTLAQPTQEEMRVRWRPETHPTCTSPTSGPSHQEEDATRAANSFGVGRKLTTSAAGSGAAASREVQGSKSQARAGGLRPLDEPDPTDGESVGRNLSRVSIAMGHRRMMDKEAGSTLPALTPYQALVEELNAKSARANLDAEVALRDLVAGRLPSGGPALTALCSAVATHFGKGTAAYILRYIPELKGARARPLEYVAVSVGSEHLLGKLLPGSHSICYQAADSGECILVPEVASDNQVHRWTVPGRVETMVGFNEEVQGAFMAVPITEGGKTLGVMCVDTVQCHPLLKEILPDQRSKLVRASLVAKDIFLEVSRREARLWGMTRTVRGGEARASHAAVSSAAERLDRTLIQQHLAAPDTAPALRTLASPELPPPDERGLEVMLALYSLLNMPVPNTEAGIDDNRDAPDVAVQIEDGSGVTSKASSQGTEVAPTDLAASPRRRTSSASNGADEGGTGGEDCPVFAPEHGGDEGAAECRIGARSTADDRDALLLQEQHRQRQAQRRPRFENFAEYAEQLELYDAERRRELWRLVCNDFYVDEEDGDPLVARLCRFSVTAHELGPQYDAGKAISVARTLLGGAGAELQDLTLHLLQQWSTLVIRSYERTALWRDARARGVWRVLESVEDELPEDDDHFYNDEANKYKLSQQEDAIRRVIENHVQHTQERAFLFEGSRSRHHLVLNDLIYTHEELAAVQKLFEHRFLATDFKLMSVIVNDTGSEHEQFAMLLTIIDEEEIADASQPPSCENSCTELPHVLPERNGVRENNSSLPLDHVHSPCYATSNSNPVGEKGTSGLALADDEPRKNEDHGASRSFGTQCMFPPTSAQLVLRKRREPSSVPKLVKAGKRIFKGASCILGPT